MNNYIMLALIFVSTLIDNSTLYSGNDQSRLITPKTPSNILYPYTQNETLNTAIIDYLTTFKNQKIPFSKALGLHPTQNISQSFRPTPFSPPCKRKRRLSILLRSKLSDASFEKQLYYALITNPNNNLSKIFLRTLELDVYLKPIRSESPFFDSPIHTLALNRSASYFVLTGKKYPKSSVDFLLNETINQDQIKKNFDEIEKENISSPLYKALKKTYEQYEAIDNALEEFEQLVIAANQ